MIYKAYHYTHVKYGLLQKNDSNRTEIFKCGYMELRIQYKYKENLRIQS